jgi:HAE1 family hydrophobic/amphiphilic exporter-1
MTLSDLSIRRPVFAWMLMAALILFGGLAFLRMGVSQLPDVDFPVITISLSYVGSAPEVMEMDIVDVVENAIMTIQGVRDVQSASQNGSAMITVEFDLDRDIELAQQDVLSKIQSVQRLLPKNMDPPIVTKVNASDVPIAWMALSSPTIPLRDLNAYVRDYLKDQFTTIEGVGDVQLGGYLEPNLRVWIDNQKLNRYYLTADDIINTIQNQNIELPAGSVETSREQFNIRTLGEVGSVDKFNALHIITRGGQPNYLPIRLGQVARVEEGLEDVQRIARANNHPAVGLGVIKQRGSNEVEVARRVRTRLAEVQKNLPPGMELNLNFDNTHFIEQAVSELNLTLVLSAVLTGLVCWLFLGSISSTLNVWLAIPTSIIGTFLIIYFAGFTLNTFTVLALTLVIGVVVDDAIMMQENIVRHQELGQNMMDAAVFGAREITFAAVAASLAIVAIFLPVAFMTGIIGRFFFQFGVTLSVAVMLSLLEAITLTPMRASQFVTLKLRSTAFGKWVERTLVRVKSLYGGLLKIALRFRWTVVIGSLIFFVLSFMSVRLLRTEFVPSQDMSAFLVQLKTPVGSSIYYTDEKFRQAEKFLSSRPEVDRTFLVIGGFTGGQVNTGFVFITMKDKGKRGIDPQKGHALSQQEFMDLCRSTFSRIPDVQVVIQDFSARGFSSSRGFPIQFTVQGPDFDKLAQYAQQMMTALNKTGLVSDLDTDYQAGQPEIRINPDRPRATARGVNVASIGNIISAMISGEVVGSYPKGAHRYDIRMKIETPESHTDYAELIKHLWVRNNRGELVPLSDVVAISQIRSLQVINRYNRERAITITANVAKGKSQPVVFDAINQIAKRVLPGGYHLVFSGSSQTFQESFASLFLALILGVFVSYMVLASQFNSFIDPVTVLIALPFSASGAFLGLLVAGQSMNIYSMIGLILLMGIVKKNSILLVDFTNRRREQGLAVKDALLEACPIRLRPILMTSIAIIAGSLPPALGIGAGAETRVPMAVAVIGGVLVSTMLTLLVVPCVYSLFTRLESKKAHHGLSAIDIPTEPGPQKP